MKVELRRGAVVENSISSAALDDEGSFMVRESLAVH
jgi:hypothetical protein